MVIGVYTYVTHVRRSVDCSSWTGIELLWWWFCQHTGDEFTGTSTSTSTRMCGLSCSCELQYVEVRVRRARTCTTKRSPVPTLQSVRKMGISGLSSWLQANFKDSFVPPPRSAEHVYIDMNGILHEAVRKCRVLNEFMSLLDSLLTDCLRHHRPLKSLTLALDGPAPIAKIEEQRRRRTARGRKMEGGPEGKLSSLDVTIGTPFMRAVDAYLEKWAQAGCSNGSTQRLPIRVIFDPSSNDGEGEVKLFKHLVSGTRDLSADTHLVLGGDADLVLLALNSPARCVLVHDPRSRRGPGAFSADRFRAAWAHFGHPNAAPVTTVGHSSDFALLALMCGNDYLPKLGSFDLTTACTAYQQTVSFGRRLVIAADTRAPVMEASISDLALDLEALAGLLAGCAAFVEDSRQPKARKYAHVDNSPEIHPIDDLKVDVESPMTAEEHSPQQLEANALDYLSGLIWNLQMYQEAACPDYGWMPCTERTTIADIKGTPCAKSLRAPSLHELSTVLADSDTRASIERNLRCPRSTRSAPSALCTALLILPATAAHLSIAPLQPVFSSPSLAHLFSQDICRECAAHRSRLARLQAQRTAEMKEATDMRERKKAMEPPLRKRDRDEPANGFEGELPSSQETAVPGCSQGGDDPEASSNFTGQQERRSSQGAADSRDVSHCHTSCATPPSHISTTGGARTPLQSELTEAHQTYAEHRKACHPAIPVHERWDAVAQAVAELDFETFSGDEMVWVRRSGPRSFDHRPYYAQHPQQYRQQHRQQPHHDSTGSSSTGRPRESR